MTLRNFLKLHQNGQAQGCVSVHQLPYSVATRRYANTYFEEADQEDILVSDVFKKIANNQVDHFHVIGGGIYKLELCIYLKGDTKNE